MALFGFFAIFKSENFINQGYFATAIIYILIFLFQWFYFVFFELVDGMSYYFFTSLDNTVAVGSYTLSLFSVSLTLVRCDLVNRFCNLSAF